MRHLVISGTAGEGVGTVLMGETYPPLASCARAVFVGADTGTLSAPGK